MIYLYLVCWTDKYATETGIYRAFSREDIADECCEYLKKNEEMYAYEYYVRRMEVHTEFIPEENEEEVRK